MENVFQNSFRNVFQNALGVGASALAGYRLSTELPTFVWDANNNFYFTQVAGGARSDHVTMTTPTVTRDIDGNLKWSCHNLADTPGTPATQGVTVVSGRDYTVEITGSGSITLSGAGSGTVTAGNPVEVTASTTTLTCTVSGSPTLMTVYQSDLGGMQNNPDGSDAFMDTQGFKRAINYDISNVREGMIDEPARTNLYTSSNDFTDGSWSEINNLLTLVAPVSAGPDGLISMTKMIDDNSGGQGSPAVVFNNTVATSTVYTQSIYAKKDQLDRIVLRTQSFTTPGNVNTLFDLLNGVVVSAGTGHTARMTDEGDDIYRCSITFTTDASDTTGQSQIYIADDVNGAFVDLDGTSSIFIGAAQFELGSFPTTYMPTDGSTVTRDVVEVSVAKANVLQIGDDVVINGEFDADTDWSKGTGWSIGSGVASCDGSQAANTILGPSSALTIVSGRTYRVTYTLSNRSAGSVKSIIGSADSALRNVDATYTDDLTASTTGNLEIRGNSTFVGDIDNVMVEEVFESEGTWVLEISGVADLAGGVLLSGASGEDVFRIGTSSAQVINDNGTTELALSSISPVLSDGGIHRMVLAFDGSGRRFSVDGNTVVSDANEYLDTSPPSAFQLLQDVAQANMPGGIFRKLTYTPQKESAAVVLALADPATAYPS